MTWPYERRHHEFSPGRPVPSETLNEVQDKLVDLHKKKYQWITRMHPYANQWILQDGIWVALGKGALHIYPDLPQGGFITEIAIKYYFTGIVTSSSDLKIEVIDYYPHLSEGIEPAIQILEQEIVRGDPGWRTKVFHLPGAIFDDRQLYLKIWDGAEGDKVASVRMAYYPLNYNT